jgi:hypothetical protein
MADLQLFSPSAFQLFSLSVFQPFYTTLSHTRSPWRARRMGMLR